MKSYKPKIGNKLTDYLYFESNKNRRSGYEDY
jgi:hypothetical protein